LQQKTSTLRSSAASIHRAATVLQGIVTKCKETAVPSTDEEIESSSLKSAFLSIAHGSLFGNATDLSLLTNLTHEDIQRLQEAHEDDAERVLQNELPQAWEHIKTLRSARIDFILDNAAFELYTVSGVFRGISSFGKTFC
jgi:hypothetical protein